MKFVIIDGIGYNPYHILSVGAVYKRTEGIYVFDMILSNSVRPLFFGDVTEELAIKKRMGLMDQIRGSTDNNDHKIHPNFFK